MIYVVAILSLVVLAMFIYLAFLRTIVSDQEEHAEPWSWIPHVEGADRQKEINAYLRKLTDEMPVKPGDAAEQGSAGRK